MWIKQPLTAPNRLRYRFRQGKLHGEGEKAIKQGGPFGTTQEIVYSDGWANGIKASLPKIQARSTSTFFAKFSAAKPASGDGTGLTQAKPAGSANSSGYSYSCDMSAGNFRKLSGLRKSAAPRSIQISSCSTRETITWNSSSAKRRSSFPDRP